jgi:hypothetical protein
MKKKQQEKTTIDADVVRMSSEMSELAKTNASIEKNTEFERLQKSTYELVV